MTPLVVNSNLSRHVLLILHWGHLEMGTLG